MSSEFDHTNGGGAAPGMARLGPMWSEFLALVVPGAVVGYSILHCLFGFEATITNLARVPLGLVPLLYGAACLIGLAVDSFTGIVDKRLLGERPQSYSDLPHDELAVVASYYAADLTAEMRRTAANARAAHNTIFALALAMGLRLVRSKWVAPAAAAGGGGVELFLLGCFVGLLVKNRTWFRKKEAALFAAALRLTRDTSVGEGPTAAAQPGDDAPGSGSAAQ